MEDGVVGVGEFLSDVLNPWSGERRVLVVQAEGRSTSSSTDLHRAPNS